MKNFSNNKTKTKHNDNSLPTTCVIGKNGSTQEKILSLFVSSSQGYHIYSQHPQLLRGLLSRRLVLAVPKSDNEMTSEKKKKRKNFSLKIQSRTSSKKSFYLFSRRSRNSRWTILTSFTLQIQFHNISNKRMPMPSRQLCYSWQSLALSHVTVQY